MPNQSHETPVRQFEAPTQPESQRLLSFYLRGHPGAPPWVSEMTALAQKGYVNFDREIQLTELGSRWCKIYLRHSKIVLNGMEI